MFDVDPFFFIPVFSFPQWGSVSRGNTTQYDLQQEGLQTSRRKIIATRLEHGM
jgi:hypothetical protein